MINEITCNSNNAIELSRGQLLVWVNTLLKSNITKIQQLGTGAFYCQLLDVIYPGKVPLSKVNWKAKFEYQYLNNFKVLQQSFTKLNIMKHIDVERLVKCKYQDNLQFLQWFKKIFDTTASTSKEYDPLQRRGEKADRQKQNKASLSASMSQTGEEGQSTRSPEQTDRTFKTQQSQRIERGRSNQKKERKFLSDLNTGNEERLFQLMENENNEEKQFYLRKIKEIQHVMEKWDTDKSSGELIENIRNIILVPAGVDWNVNDEGCFTTKQ